MWVSATKCRYPHRYKSIVHQPGPLVNPGDNWYTPLLEESVDPPGVSLAELVGELLNVLLSLEELPGPSELEEVVEVEVEVPGPDEVVVLVVLPAPEGVPP